MPWRSWKTSDILSAPDLRALVSQQTVAVFPDAATRDATVPASRRVEGMLVHLTDTGTFWYWTGTAWVQVKADDTGLSVTRYLQTVHKTSDQTFAASTAVQQISGLSTVGVTNARFQLRALVVYTGSGTSAIQFGFTSSAGSASATVQPSSSVVPQLAGLPSNGWLAPGPAGATRAVWLHGYVSFGGSASPVSAALRFTSGPNVTVLAGSWMQAIRIS